MSYSGGWRPHLECALCLDLARLLEIGALQPGRATAGSVRWPCDDGERGSIGYRADLGDASGTLTLAYQAGGRAERETIELETLACHYGGRRWYFRCPASGRRALKLYKWPGLPMFRHREAVRPRPTYASQRVSGMDRIIARRWALRRKLGDDITDLFDEPMKPKRMHQRTFERYAARDAELANREWPYMGRLLGRLGVAVPDEAAAPAEESNG